MAKTDNLTSYNGVTLPPIGLGTYRLNGFDGTKTIGTAIDIGYRLIDSAVNYENEGAVGKAVRDSSVSREELIVTSKLPGRRHGFNSALLTVEETLLGMGLDYIDLYLIHWPNPKVDRYVEAWQALLEAQERGLVKWIGVSNFTPEYLQRLQQETGVLPSVNQIQMHPYYPDSATLEFNQANGILTEAWSPLARADELMGEDVIGKVAQTHDATPAQVVLAWHMARGVIPIPKSATPQRLASNFESLELELGSEEVEAITALGQGDSAGRGKSANAGRVLDLDPEQHEEL